MKKLFLLVVFLITSFACQSQDKPETPCDFDATVKPFLLALIGSCGDLAQGFVIFAGVTALAPTIMAFPLERVAGQPPQRSRIPTVVGSGLIGFGLFAMIKGCLSIWTTFLAADDFDVAITDLQMRVAKLEKCPDNLQKQEESL